MEFNSIDKYVKRSWVNVDFWPGHIPCGLSLDLTLVFHDDIFWYHFSKTNNPDSSTPWWLPNLLQTALVLMRYCRDWLLMGQDLPDWDTEINIFSEGVSEMSGFITEMTRMTDTYYRSIHQCACHSERLPLAGQCHKVTCLTMNHASRSEPWSSALHEPWSLTPCVSDLSCSSRFMRCVGKHDWMIMVLRNKWEIFSPCWLHPVS